MVEPRPTRHEQEVTATFLRVHNRSIRGKAMKGKLSVTREELMVTLMLVLTSLALVLGI